MSAEQDKFRAWLVAQPPEEILNHTVEYTTHEDILMAMDFIELTEAQVSALLESPSPLADVYKNWSNMEPGQDRLTRYARWGEPSGYKLWSAW